MDACWVSQSVFYEVLNTVSDDVFLKKYVIGNVDITFHSAFKKEYWKGCFIRSERIDTSYCQVQDWKRCFFHQTSFLGIWNFNNKNNCAHERVIHSATQFGSWFLKKIYITRRKFLHRGAAYTIKVSMSHTKKFFSS